MQICCQISEQLQISPNISVNEIKNAKSSDVWFDCLKQSGIPSAKRSCKLVTCYIAYNIRSETHVYVIPIKLNINRTTLNFKTLIYCDFLSINLISKIFQ